MTAGVVTGGNGSDPDGSDLQDLAGTDLDELAMTQESQRPDSILGTSGQHNGDSVRYLPQ